MNQNDLFCRGCGLIATQPLLRLKMNLHCPECATDWTDMDNLVEQRKVTLPHSVPSLSGLIERTQQLCPRLSASDASSLRALLSRVEVLLLRKEDPSTPRPLGAEPLLPNALYTTGNNLLKTRSIQHRCLGTSPTETGETSLTMFFDMSTEVRYIAFEGSGSPLRVSSLTGNQLVEGSRLSRIPLFARIHPGSALLFEAEAPFRVEVELISSFPVKDGF